jgi:DNA gyrase subunit B
MWGIIHDEKMEFDFEDLSSYFRRLSFLNPNLKFTLKDYDNDKEHVFLSKNGISDYLNYLAKDNKVIRNDVYYEGVDNKNNDVKIILNYTDADDETIKAFCNSIWNSDGGTHVTGFKMGLVIAFKNFIKEQNLIPKKSDITIDDITGDDIREGLIAIIDLKHKDPLYASQTKLQLTNRDTQGFIQKLTNDDISEWLTQNLSDGKKLAQKIINNAISRKLVKTVKEKNKRSSILKSNKLSDCTGHDKEKCEIWITEGLSAGGSAKSCRDKTYQAIYSLRGKPLNSQSLSLNKVYTNKELNDLINILGGVGEDFSYEKLKYNKIIIMADADVDGADGISS